MRCLWYINASLVTEVILGLMEGFSERRRVEAKPPIPNHLKGLSQKIEVRCCGNHYNPSTLGVEAGL